MADILGIWIAVGVVVIGLLIIFIKTNLVICNPNEVLIFSGRKRTSPDGHVVGYRIIRGGRGFRIPFIENVSRMSLNTMPIEISITKALTRGIIPINVESRATMKIAGSEEAGLGNAIERFLGRNPNDVAAVARENIEGSLRGILATLTPEEANARRLEVAEQVLATASRDLQKLGLVLDTFKIQNISDEQGYLEAIGRKRNAEVEKEARIAEARAEADARQVSADAKRLGSVAEFEAEKTIVESENALRVKRAKLQAESNMAEERANVARDIAHAEEEKNLESIRVDLNKMKYHADVVVPAHAEKEADELRAQGKAARILEDGKATAEALAELRKQWENGETRDLMLLQMLPQLLDHVSHVLKDNLHIERLTVVDSGNGNGIPGFVSSLAGSIVSVFEQLKNATGLDITQILQPKEEG